ncbi:MAG: 3-hydroxybutyrate oligomer hydrolase family protein [Pseudoxanthomonas sp.]
MIAPQRVSVHRGGDDLLSAGLGLGGLQAMLPPAFADPVAPTPAELRRRAIWSSWRGIADLSPSGGYGGVYGSLAEVPGREYAALARVPGASQPHRLLVQVPDAFDLRRRCVVVAPSSGSRGVYGAIAVGGAWGLPRGCALAYTDKGTGSDYFDLDAGRGFDLDGTVAAPGEAPLAFAPKAAAGASGVAFKHAHSQDNPEADWGRHVQQAAQFALAALDEAFPQAAPFTFANTRVIAVGISNGGGAVLRASELDGDWLDAVVAGEPNVYAEGAPGARPLYDFATEAAILMPCALLDLPMGALPQPPLRAQAEPLWAARCLMLKSLGLVEGSNPAAQAVSAHAQLRAKGWTDRALAAGALSVGFDLWRAIAAAYASAYGRYAPGEHPCGYRWSAQNADLSPRPALAGERAAWWPDAAGIPPGNGVGLIDSRMAAPDFALPGLQCLRALWEGQGADAERVRTGIRATRAGLPRAGLPVLVVHGLDDGLVPPAFTSAPWVAAAQAVGREQVRYWQVEHGEHFDAFLALPDYGARYAPLLPYVYAALDRVEVFLDGTAALPADAVIAARGRGLGAVDAVQLALPAQP